MSWFGRRDWFLWGKLMFISQPDRTLPLNDRPTKDTSDSGWRRFCKLGDNIYFYSENWRYLSAVTPLVNLFVILHRKSFTSAFSTSIIDRIVYLIYGKKSDGKICKMIRDHFFLFLHSRYAGSFLNFFVRFEMVWVERNVYHVLFFQSTPNIFH